MRIINDLRIVKGFVVLAIVLILCMPISSAVLLNNIQVSGSDGIPGVRRTVDITSVSVDVTDVGNGTDVMSQLTFITPGLNAALPTTCEGGGNSYNCVYTSSNLPLPSNSYIVSAHFPGATSISRQFIADGDGPRTVSLNIYQDGEVVKADYYVHDPEYTGTNMMTCSGINTIDFYVNGEVVYTVEEGLTSEETRVCEKEDTVILPITTDGTHEVFIKASDILGNTKPSDLRIVETDFTPAVIDNTFKLIKGGEEIAYLNTESIHNDMTIQFGLIEASDLSIVYGDLSDLNDGGFYDNTEIRPLPMDARNVCNLVDSNTHSWICEFYGVNIDLGTNSPVIQITVKDAKGIEVKKGLNSEFIIDNGAPLLEFAGTNITHDGVSYATPPVINFVAKLQDSGAGFGNSYTDVLNDKSGHNFIFNLINFNGDAIVPATNCTQSGSTWMCNYELINVNNLINGESLLVAVNSNSKDDAGNLVEVPETLNKYVIIDLEDPILFGNITVMETNSERTDWFQGGDTLSFTADIIEGESVIIPENALADFSQLVEDDANYKAVPAVSCIPEVRLWDGNCWFDSEGNELVSGCSDGSPLITYQEEDEEVEEEESDEEVEEEELDEEEEEESGEDILLKGNTGGVVVSGNSINSITGAISAISYAGLPPMFDINSNEYVPSLVQTATDIDLEEDEYTVYTCKWEVEDVIPSGSGTFDNIVFTVKDMVGNEVVRNDVFIWILSLSTDENPDYFRYVAGNATPPQIDRRAIEFIDYGVFVPIYIEEYYNTPSGIKDASPLKVTFNECVEQGENGTYLKNTTLFGGITNPSTFSLFVQFYKGSTYNDVDQISLVCDFDVISRYGGYRVSNLEKENVTINVGLFSSKYDPLSDSFLKRLKKKTIMMTDWLNWIEMAEGALNNLKSLCDLSATITHVQRVMDDVDSIILGVSMALYPLKPKMAKKMWELWHDKAYCEYKEHVSDKLNWGLSSFGDEKSEGVVGLLHKACSITTCDYNLWSLTGADDPDKAENEIKDAVKWMNEGTVDKINTFITGHKFKNQSAPDSKTSCGNTGNQTLKVGLYPEGGFTLSDLGFPTMNKRIPDAKSSIYMAIASGCFPAIIHHLARYRQIECKYLKCMGEMAVSGTSFDTCENDKATETCEYVVGPFMDVIPNPVEYVQNVADWAKQVVETRPMTLFAMNPWTGPACQTFMNASKTMRIGCNTGKFGLDIKKAADTNFLLYATLTAAPYGACAYMETQQKIADLESMNILEKNLTDWIKVSEVWNKDEANICKNADVVDLMEKLSALE